jgi:hypothetical protein
MTGALASRFTTNLGIGLILAAILVPLVGRYAYAGLLAVAVMPFLLQIGFFQPRFLTAGRRRSRFQNPHRSEQTGMPQVLNIRHLPGFAEHRPIIPPDAVYIGRRNARYGLAASKWANPFSIRREADREEVIATYERWLRLQPHLMDALHELRGLDLVCWCAPVPCHGDVLLRLLEPSPP